MSRQATASTHKYRTARDIPDAEVVRVAIRMKATLSPTTDLVKAVRDEFRVSENVAAKAVQRVLERGLLTQEIIMRWEPSPAGSFNVLTAYTRWTPSA